MRGGLDAENREVGEVGETSAARRLRPRPERIEQGSIVRTDRGFSTYPGAPFAQGQPSGIGGWLVLPMLGLFFTPLNALVALFSDILPAFGPDIWPNLTSPGSAAYHPLWVPLLLFEVVAEMVHVAAPIVLLIFFFRRKAVLPRLMVCFYIFVAVVVLVDAVVTVSILRSIDVALDAGYARDLVTNVVRMVMLAAIWIPYFLFSKRVRNTFIG